MEFDALLVPLGRFRNVAAWNLKEVRGFYQLQSTPADGDPLLVGVRRLFSLPPMIATEPKVQVATVKKDGLELDPRF
jgi:hypothetical protein